MPSKSALLMGILPVDFALFLLSLLFALLPWFFTLPAHGIPADTLILILYGFELILVVVQAVRDPACDKDAARGILEASPEQQVQKNEALRDVWALLRRLSPRRRTVFLLHEVDGFTLPEAAALIGISVTAAKKCVWRARRDIDRLVRKDPALLRAVEEWRHDL